jgi:hypothetical protein
METIPDTLVQAKESLLKAVLDSYQEEYKRIINNWNRLETKAQGSVAIAGIFIAGAFAYLRENIALMQCYQKIMLGAGIICLLIAVLFSILALRIRQLPVPPMGKYVDRLVCDLLTINDKELFERIPLLIKDQISGWRQARDGLLDSNSRKAKNVWIGQILLVVAILIVGVLALTTMMF